MATPTALRTVTELPCDADVEPAPYRMATVTTTYVHLNADTVVRTTRRTRGVGDEYTAVELSDPSGNGATVHLFADAETWLRLLVEVQAAQHRPAVGA